MIPQLSLHSPEMTGVIHHSMWLLSVVCGLGLASGLTWQREGAKGGPAEAWLMGAGRRLGW